MKYLHLTLSALALMMAGAQAQQAQQAAPSPDAAPVGAPAELRQVRHIVVNTDNIAPVVVLDGGEMGMIGEEMHSARVVKGAPYCADAVHETVQPLADGNRIVHSHSTRLCRDGEGRTRQESERDGHHTVFLNDPVAKEAWLLDTDNKTARRLANLMGGVDATAWQAYGDAMRVWADKIKTDVRVRISRDDGEAPSAPPMPPLPPTAAVAPLPPIPPAPVVLSQDDKMTRDAQGREHREVRVQVMRVDGAPGIAPMPDVPPPPMVLARAMAFAPRGPGSTSSLGSKEIEGQKANGERTSWTIAAGKIGNEKPIVITRDVWTSPELMLTVLSHDSDPRSGEINYRLEHIKRGEPDAALLRVPADFKRSEAGQPRAPRAASAAH